MKAILHHPKKSLGQNFLVDKNIVRKFVEHLKLNEDDDVLEIGAGYGSLTEYIINEVKKLYVVEIDKNLCKILQSKFGEHPNFHLIEEDIKNLPLNEILAAGQNWKIVGNIPYHLTSSIIFKIFDSRDSIQSLTLTVQKEVAQRIIAEPNSKDFGILSVLSQLFADVNILFVVSKNVFYPKPKVDSAVVQWTFLPQSRYNILDEQFFVQMVRNLFNQRRKIIKNSLKFFYGNISELDFPLNKRPEQLSAAELVRLSNLISYGRKRH